MAETELACELRRCTAYGCGKPWPHPVGTTSTLCAACVAVAERLRCLKILEHRQIVLNRQLATLSAVPEIRAKVQAALHEVVSAAAQMRALPEQTA